MANIIIVGAGLAGMSCGLLLNKFGHSVTILERKTFPFHKVCGEYVSNEVLPFLNYLGVAIEECGPSRLTRFKITTPAGKEFEMPLDLGGFGLSRYRFDQLLYERAIVCGIEFKTGTKVTDIKFIGNSFHVELADHTVLPADLVVGAYGKRSNLDQKLQRRFFYNRSPYMGVKYHVRTDFPTDLIQLDTFSGGYSGVCKIEDDKYSLCYLSRTENLRQHQSIAEMERKVLFQNRFLRKLYEGAEFLPQPTEVINQVTFEQKPVVENHILFCGDSAGMISPLCGNGMAMAIHSGKILAETVDGHLKNDAGLQKRAELEHSYRRAWQRQFQSRIYTGQVVQRFFLKPWLAEVGLRTFKTFSGVAVHLMKKSHGRPF